LTPLFIWLAITIPSIAGVLAFAFRKKAGYVVTCLSLATFALIAYNIGDLLEGKVLHLEGFTWWPTPAYKLSFGIIADPLSLLMGLIVSFLSALIFIYSIEYMANEGGKERFWFFMGCFEASMLLLVFSDNFIMSLIGWEGVGLSSFFLIGHYYDDKRDKWIGGPEGQAPFAKPSFCGLKALLVTGLADTFMLMGIMIIYSLYGTFNFLELQEVAATRTVSPVLLLIASIFVILGPLGKSAQFPFQEWLPEAMSGPTPVSALLHSATMVKAGVYMVARLLPFYYIMASIQPAASQSFFIIAVLSGLVTTILGATYGTTAVEAKKVLAYSTMSQIGYMFVALGIAGLSGNPLLGFAAALFFLFAHSIFKASLFLSTGIVVHETHTIYITKMGGLRKVIPKTFIAMSLAALCLAGLPPLIGFWSKDALLAAVYPINVLVAVLAASVAALTAFYSVRFISFIFLGETKNSSYKGSETKLMLGSAMLLASLTLIFGLIGPYLEGAFHEFFHLTFGISGGYQANTSLALVSSIIFLGLGLGTAYLVYFKRSVAFTNLLAWLRPARNLLCNRPLDRAYYLIVTGTLSVSRGLYSFEKTFERATAILAKDIFRLATSLRRIQGGDLNSYLGIAGFFLLLLMLLLLIMGA
jgi:NADH-quinone oxidoreductase subunit L